MKLPALLACSISALSTPVFAQDTPAATPPKFDWKLRWSKGQTWTQTFVVHIHSVEHSLITPGNKIQKMESDRRQTLTSKNEVVEATPDYYLLRVTYTGSKVDASSKIDDKSQPQSFQITTQPDPVGVSFLIKQAPDGHVLDATELEDLVALQKKVFADFAKNAYISGFGNTTISVASLKRTIIRNSNFSPLPRPLAIGESYSYTVVSPLVAELKFISNSKRTLLSFDAQTAVFDEADSYFLPPRQTPWGKGNPVTLMGSAAQLYWAQSHRPKPASPIYLSKNGRLYYREAANPAHVIWLDPPVTGIKLSQSEAEPYRNVQGFDGQTTGAWLGEFFPHYGNNGISKPSRHLPPAVSSPKAFFTMSSILSGKSTVDAVTGLILQSDLTQTINGKTSIVNANGSKQTLPFLTISQITTSTQKD